MMEEKQRARKHIVLPVNRLLHTELQDTTRIGMLK